VAVIQQLFVREGTRYALAGQEQVLEAAQGIVDARMVRGVSFKDPTVACAFFRDKLGHLEREVFVAVMLDARHRMIDYVELFLGTIDGAEVHPREVARVALRLNAAAIVVAHNHPSGTIQPSESDKQITQKLKSGGEHLDIRILDHIIVTETQYFSFSDAGIL